MNHLTIRARTRFKAPRRRARPRQTIGPLHALALLALVAASLALALAPAASASARSHSSCAHRARTHHPAHACANRRSRPRSRVHHSGARHSSSGSASTQTGLSTVHRVVLARCENGASAVADSEGDFSCQDGSEPECAAGRVPTISESGALLLCEPEASETGSEVVGSSGSGSGGLSQAGGEAEEEPEEAEEAGFDTAG